MGVQWKSVGEAQCVFGDKVLVAPDHHQSSMRSVKSEVLSIGQKQSHTVDCQWSNRGTVSVQAPCRTLSKGNLNSTRLHRVELEAEI